MNGDHLESIFECIDQQLKLLCSNDQLRNNLKFISTNVQRLLVPAKDHNFQEVEANGFHSVIKLCLKFGELVLDKLDTIDDHYDDLVACSRYIKGLTELACDMADHNQNGINGDSDEDHRSNMFLYSVQNEKDFAILLTKFPGFWCKPSPTSHLFKAFNWTLKAFALPKCNWFDPECDALSMTKSLFTMNFKAMSPLSVICLKFTSFWLRTFIRFPDLNTQTVYIPRTSKFEIPSDGSKVVYNTNRVMQGSVRCRLINKRDDHLNKALILHCHGGGFALGCPEFDEALYLRSWCQRLPNCAILSIEYPLSVPHPRALQTILDVYIWLTTSEEVQMTLGFTPTKIILCGDSAGSALMLQLSLVLYDITHLTEHKFLDVVKLPSAIVLFFGAFSLVPLTTPSKLISHVDSFLFSTSLLSMQATYSGLDEDKSISQGWIPHWMSGLASLLRPNSDIARHLQSHEHFKDYSNKVFEAGLNTYANPLGYKATKELTIPLFLISSHFCPLLDDSVKLAKAWKGPVTMKVFEDCPHGAYFLQFGRNFKEVIKLMEKALLCGCEKDGWTPNANGHFW